MMFCLRKNSFLLFFGNLLVVPFTSNKVATAVDCDANIVKDVAIVGGGLAGLFAASVLDKAGWSYVLIEAEDFLGGRLHSIESPFNFLGTTPHADPVTLEMGANFMYGFGNRFGINPIYGLFDEYNLDFYVQSIDDQVVFRKNGKKYSKKKVRKERRNMQKFVRKCLDKAGNDWFDEYLSPNGTTSLDMSAKRILKQCNYTDGWTAGNDLLRKAMAYIYAGGAENLLKLKDIGKAAYPEDSSEEFDERVFFQKDQNGGTTRMLNEDFVCDHLPNGLIHNNSVVTRIDRTVSPAELTATRWPDTAAACTQDYEVKYVIVTMPQNVLIQEQSTIFNPELSINNHPVKQNIAEKVWFQWDNPWWDQSKQWIVVANGKQDGKGTLWLNYNHPNLLPGSNLLMTFLDENQLDAMGGSVVIPDMLEAGLENLPGYENSSSSYKTDWMNDPFARGGWEIWELGKTYEDFDEAIEPQGILHLAGAAHCRNFFGFTWGAIFSGIFSAEWVAGRLGGDTLEAAKPAFNPCFDNDGIKKAEWQGFYAPYDWFCVPQNTK